MSYSISFFSIKTGERLASSNRSSIGPQLGIRRYSLPGAGLARLLIASSCWLFCLFLFMEPVLFAMDSRTGHSWRRSITACLFPLMRLGQRYPQSRIATGQTPAISAGRLDGHFFFAPLTFRNNEYSPGNVTIYSSFHDESSISFSFFFQVCLNVR